jgi:hypothetical protein
MKLTNPQFLVALILLSVFGAPVSGQLKPGGSRSEINFREGPGKMPGFI